MRIVVIGSGVAGTHAALTLLERGHAVELWDIGVVDAVPPAPDATFHGLKAALPEPEAYFLGRNLEAMVPPGASELLRYPPSRRFLARSDDPLWPFVERGFAAHASFATGGLANGWGANALAFDDDDMAGWPVSFADMAPAYRVAFDRVPVAGPPEDALSPYFPGVRASQAPVRTSRADDILLARSTSRTRVLARRGVHIGRARLAVVTDPLRPDACTYCDRCLWGCPRGSIYNPATSTLAACAAYPGFRHLRGRHVVSLITNADRVTGLRFLDLAGDTVRDEACDAVFLAAGALQSGAIFLRTLKQAHPDLPPESEALMDTAVVKIPYVLLRALGQPADERAFQFNRLILGLVGSSADWPRYLHGEVLHLTGLTYHPLIEHMPFDSRTASHLFFAMKSALGVVSLFFPDKPSPGNRQVLEAGGGRWDPVRLEYTEAAAKQAYITRAVARVRSALWALGCVPRAAVPAASGAGIHYAGTIPMGEGARCCGADGRSNRYPNLFVADGAAFPTLPSKSITMSLAAHAIRVANGAAL